MILKGSKIFLLAILFISFSSTAFTASDYIELRKDIYKRAPKVGEPAEPSKEHVYVGAAYEYGQGQFATSEKPWTVLSGRIGYLYKGLQLPYVQVSRYTRSGEPDYTFEAGGYYRIKRAFLNLEGGVGSDVDYIYKYKALGELNHPIYKNLYMKEKYKFLRYNNEDFNIVSPGLIYYFGNNYIDAEYDCSISNKRGAASYGSLKVSLNVKERVDFQFGGVVGERLYDILGLPNASGEFGYIFYFGPRIYVIRNMYFNLNLLYGHENPNFEYVSVTSGLSYAF